MKVWFLFERISETHDWDLGLRELLSELKECGDTWEILAGRAVYERWKTEKSYDWTDRDLVISDDRAMVKELAQSDIFCVGLESECKKERSSGYFEGTSLVVESLEALDASFLRRELDRYHSRPVRIAETERLLIRESRAGDFERLYAISREKGNDRYTETMGTDKEAEREKFLAYINTVYAYHGSGLWTVIRKSDGAIAGWCGLIPDGAEKPEEPEIGYLIGQNFRRQGYAMEACQAVLHFAFEELEYASICARIRRGNYASVVLVQKLGFCKTAQDHDETYWKLSQTRYRLSAQSPNHVRKLFSL